MLMDPYLSSHDGELSSTAKIGSQSSFLNDLQLEKLKLGNKRVRIKMTLTGKLNPEDDTIFLKVQISEESEASQMAEDLIGSKLSHLKKYIADTLKLSANQQEEERGKEPKEEVYRDQRFSITRHSSNESLDTTESDTESANSMGLGRRSTRIRDLKTWISFFYALTKLLMEGWYLKQTAM